MNASELETLQRWMTTVITHADDAAAAVRSRPARSAFPVSTVNAGEVVLPNDRMDVYSRLDVYNGGYFTRLKEVLESDFRALKHALGEEAWRDLALSYVTRHPSQHPNLNVFHRLLPGFIANRNIEHRAFLRDLAQLEAHMAHAFDAPACTPADPQKLASIPPDQVEQATFVSNPSLRLLTSIYPVNQFLQQVYDGQSPPPLAEAPPARAQTNLAIYRRDERVWRLNMPRPMFLVLSALVEGQPLGVAIEAGGEHEESFQHWFQEWSADGLFADIEC